MCPWFGWGSGWLMGGPLMMIMMVLFWGAAIYGVFLLFRRLSGGRCASTDQPDRAIAILRERYAKGEITQEEYERIKKDL